MMLVAGVDSSTQSTKVLLCQADDGTVVGQASAPHPDGTECHPELWWQALGKAGRGLLDRADAIGVAAQQHGMVVLDEDGQVIRPALLWNDMRSAPQAAALIAELGGPSEWARRTGSVPTASFTVTKLRWLAEHEPAFAERTARVLLPHDWLTWRLGDGMEPATDRGDASGTGYFSPATGQWLPEIATAALGHPVGLPRLAAPAEIVGRTPDGAALSAGTGDNMGAALGLGVGLGEVVVSIGTSGTAYAVAAEPAADASGLVAGFADATGRFLPLVATVNAARILTATARMLGTDAAGLSSLALAAPAGASGLTLLPYLDGERSPNRPGASGVLRGLTSTNTTPENLARAAVEALLCSLADAIGNLADCGITAQRVILIGGAARSEAVRRIAPAVFGVPVTVPPPAEYVALGAARQAAWALSGAASPPRWPLAGTSAEYTAEPDLVVRERYATLRDATVGWGA
ncbi:MAG TPA: xylulokinase [Streptosporangiaceae bacterium]|nr:xylulokinase [Streptosporangiaceae bacterium]